MKKLALIIIVAVLCLALLCGCTQNQPQITKIPASGIDYADATHDFFGKPSSRLDEGGVYTDFATSGKSWASTPSAGTPIDSSIGGSGNTQFQIAAGQITCGAVCDQEDYAFWLSLFDGVGVDDNQQATQAGLFNGYLTRNYGFNTLHQIKVTVLSGQTPVPYAKVVLMNDSLISKTVFTAVTNAAGVAYLYAPNSGSYTVLAQKGNVSAEVAASTTDNNKVTIALNADTERAQVIDVLFVVDTTGSMMDEIDYLKAEIADTVNRIEAQCGEGTKVRIGFLFYRDHGDEYVTRLFDFNDDLAVIQSNLAVQTAAGGGDFEEAVDEALLIAAKGYEKDGQVYGYSWSENSTKILVHVLDAPIHDGQEYESRYNEAVAALCEMGVRVVTVAASGVDTKCQYTFRAVSMLTGGRYVFITDHSGIGNPHDKPETTEYTVEYLNDCLVRLLSELHTGQPSTPIPIQQSNSVN